MLELTQISDTKWLTHVPRCSQHHTPWDPAQLAKVSDVSRNNSAGCRVAICRDTFEAHDSIVELEIDRLTHVVVPAHRCISDG